MKDHKYFFLGFLLKREFLFWGMLALVAAFYLAIGNDMHKEKNDLFKSVEENISK